MVRKSMSIAEYIKKHKSEIFDCGDHKFIKINGKDIEIRPRKLRHRRKHKEPSKQKALITPKRLPSALELTKPIKKAIKFQNDQIKQLEQKQYLEALKSNILNQIQDLRQSTHQSAVLQSRDFQNELNRLARQQTQDLRTEANKLSAMIAAIPGRRPLPQTGPQVGAQVSPQTTPQITPQITPQTGPKTSTTPTPPKKVGRPPKVITTTTTSTTSTTPSSPQPSKSANLINFENRLDLKTKIKKDLADKLNLPETTSSASLIRELERTHPNSAVQLKNLAEFDPSLSEQTETDINTILNNIPQTGLGDDKDNLSNLETQEGLYNTDIEKIMAPLVKEPNNFLGVYAADEIYKMVPLIHHLETPVFSFIFNLDKHNQPGSHWNATFIDARTKSSDPNAQSVEYYDSFAREPTLNYLKQLKLLIDALVKRFNIDYYLKFKNNRIIDQNARGLGDNDCGYFCIKFLLDRYKGIPFKDATPFNDSKNQTPELEKFKQKLIKFGYIYYPGKPHSDKNLI